MQQSASIQRDTQKKAEVDEAGRVHRAKLEKLCADPRFEPYYSKTPCVTTQITFAQLTDKSKISPAAKAIFMEVRNAVDEVNRDYLMLQSKYFGAAGAKQADLFMLITKVKNDKNNLDLYNGAITWGQYNRQRQEIISEFDAAAKNLK